jgi:trk system potassium uptake protein TrkH
MLFIILGSIPFIAYIKFIGGNKKIIFKDTQIKTFFKIIICSIIILYVYVSIINKSFVEINLRSVSFNVISILTGTGYVTKDFDNWGSFSLIFFLVLMFIGGCAGSTSCGIKIFRVQLLYKFLIVQLKKIIYPSGVFKIKYDNSNVDEKFMSSIISFIYLYVLVFFIITALLSINGLDFVSSLSAAATSISNVGPGLGDVIGPNGNFSSLSDSSKWILSFGMILGRLELFAILVLFIPAFWRRY